MAEQVSEQSIFLHAVALTSPADRAAYLDDVCREKPGLRLELDGLLAAHERLGAGPLPTGTAPAPTIDEPITQRPGTVIGPYKLLEQIGEGGFGVVFMAEQERPIRRKVALKLIKPGMDTRQVIARFEAERQALALMDHPNTAKVLDAGQTSSGRPYFVMDLVKGVPITEYCDQTQLTPRERLELFVPVCQAVQHAHQKGIIHRDIKPSNVLVTLHDGAPVPKIIDFGIAKALGQQLTDKTLFTGFAQLVGTPLYMSPEQAELSGLDVDTRTDIYSLGVLLYELLTGTTPFDKERLHQADFDQIRRIIREEEPPKPSTRISTLGKAAATISTQRKSDPRRLSQLFRAELDWIVMKCLDKDRNRRYETANGLAMDVQRYLHDEPVLACPPSLGYRLRKFGRKNGKLLATAAAFAALLVTVAVVASVSAWRLREEQAATSQQLQETIRAQDQTKLELYRSLVADARANRLSRRAGRRLRSLEILADATRLARELQLPDNDYLELRNETIACLPLVDVRVAKTWEGCPARTILTHFDANLERYVRFDHKHGVASVRRVADDSEVCEVGELGQFTDVPNLGLSPDGEFLCLRGGSRVLKVWRVTNGGAELLLPPEPGSTLSFSPDSRRLAMARQDGAIRIYELPSGKQVKEWRSGPSPDGLAFHPQKPQLAVRRPGQITVFDLDSGNKLSEFVAPGGWDFGWHPDGRQLATSAPDFDYGIYLWDASTGKRLQRLAGHTAGGVGLAFNPAGDLLASADWAGTLRLWDARTGQELFKTTWAGVLRFSRNGRLLAADVTDHRVRLWEVIPACGYQSLVREPHLGTGRYGGLAVSGRHRLLAVGMLDGVGLWELPGGRPLTFLPLGDHGSVAFEPSGALLTHGATGELRWPVEAVGPAGTLRLGPPQPLPFPASRSLISSSRDGKVMACAQFRGALVWHADKADPLIPLGPQHDVRSIAVSPNGWWVATGSHWATDVYVKVWDARTGRRVADLPVECSSWVGFSPDDRWLVTTLVTTGDGCRLWEVGTWREGPRIGGGAFAFSPDGKVLAVETGSGVVRLVDPDNGREYARLEDPNQDRAYAMTFSTDGSQLFVSTRDSPAIHGWDLRAIRAELAKRDLDWGLPPYRPAGNPKDAPPLQITVDLGDLSPWKKALALNNQAWSLATNPDAKLRDPARAVELAQKAVKLCPKEPLYWNTLGVANYRAGHWKKAIKALTKSMELQKGKLERFDTFFLAMAHWRVDEKEKARQWYERAVLWMEKNKNPLKGNKHWPEELRRFRAEAAALLGVEAQPAEQEKKTPPPKNAKQQSPTGRQAAADAPKKNQAMQRSKNSSISW
jgi:serine/threonine protein kinase/WD40 repeat protein